MKLNGSTTGKHCPHLRVRHGSEWPQDELQFVTPHLEQPKTRSLEPLLRRQSLFGQMGAKGRRTLYHRGDARRPLPGWRSGDPA